MEVSEDHGYNCLKPGLPLLLVVCLWPLHLSELSVLRVEGPWPQGSCLW